MGAQSNVNDRMSDNDDHATPWTRGAAIQRDMGEMGIESRCLDHGMSIDSRERKKERENKKNKT